MAKPDKLLIPYFEHEHSRFHHVGRCGPANQFMAFVIGAFPADWWSDRYALEYQRSRWAEHKRWYAVLHRFDSVGNHLSTEAESGGTSDGADRAAMERAVRLLDDMLASLGDSRPCDIEVKPFGLEIDGYLFGLIGAGFRKLVKWGVAGATGRTPCTRRFQSGKNSTWPAHSSASLAAQMRSRLSMIDDTAVRWLARSKPFIGRPAVRRAMAASLMVLTSWETTIHFSAAAKSRTSGSVHVAKPRSRSRANAAAGSRRRMPTTIASFRSLSAR
jgi:hypothetical protein